MGPHLIQVLGNVRIHRYRDVVPFHPTDGHYHREKTRKLRQEFGDLSLEPVTDQQLLVFLSSKIF